MAGAAVDISTRTTIIDEGDTDGEINVAIAAVGTISNVLGVTAFPISNTKSRLVILYT